MNNTGIAILVGVLAGVAGAVAVGLITGPKAADDSGAMAVDGGADLSSVIERLDRIEATLGKEQPLGPGALVGSGSAESQRAAEARMDAWVAKLKESLKPTIEESVKAATKASMSEMMETGDGTSIRIGDGVSWDGPKKKEVTLAELSAELSLTAEEEESVRQIAKETTDEFLKLLTTDDESIDDVRREFESARDDTEKRNNLRTKYMGRMMSNLGGVISLGLNWQSKMKKAVGAEKADKIENGYKVKDLDPYGLEDMFDFD